MIVNEHPDFGRQTNKAIGKYMAKNVAYVMRFIVQYGIRVAFKTAIDQMKQDGYGAALSDNLIEFIPIIITISLMILVTKQLWKLRKSGNR